jgi:hypothetical protein
LAASGRAGTAKLAEVKIDGQDLVEIGGADGIVSVTLKKTQEKPLNVRMPDDAPVIGAT